MRLRDKLVLSIAGGVAFGGFLINAEKHFRERMREDSQPKPVRTLEIERVNEGNSEVNEQNNYRERLVNMISRYEGRRNIVYRDTRGIRTIGVGFNLERAGAREAIENLSLNYNSVLNGRVALTDNQISQLM